MFRGYFIEIDAKLSLNIQQQAMAIWSPLSMKKCVATWRLTTPNSFQSVESYFGVGKSMVQGGVFGDPMGDGLAYHKPCLPTGGPRWSCQPEVL